MIAVVLKGIAGRKLRALLTAFAIVFGVAMVSGTFILTDTLEASLKGLTNETTSKTDAAVFEKEIVKGSQGPAVTVTGSLLEQIRALPQVATAVGDVAPQKNEHTAEIIGRDGRPAKPMGFGRGFDPKTTDIAPVEAGAFSPMKLKTGDWPEGSGEVVIDAHTATKQRYGRGDSIVIKTATGRHRFEISGTVTFVGEELPPRPSVAIWDLKTAQEVLDRRGVYDVISVDAKRGVTEAQLVRAIRPLLPSNLQVRANAASVRDAERDFDKGMAAVRAFLFGFGFIALLVGAFVIFNSLSITVAQRTRELATLRTLGASRKQVLRSVKLEGIVLGLLASVIGIAIGFGVAEGMVAVMASFGFELPKATPVVAQHTIVMSVLLGTGVTLLASLIPARRAPRVPPIAAVREGAVLASAKPRSRTAGLIVAAASLMALALGAFAGLSTGLTVLALSGGSLGLFAGVGMLASRLVRPLVRAVGWPARRAGGPAGVLASANAVRNPGRTASTAATLMIGLGLITLVSLLGAGMTASTKQAVTDQVQADYVLAATNERGFDAVATGGATSQVLVEKARVGRSDTAVTAVDPATIERYYRFAWTKGSLGRDGAVVTKSFAEAKRVTVGGRLVVTTPKGVKTSVVVRGIYDPPGGEELLGKITITRARFDALFEHAKTRFVFADAPIPAVRDAKLHTREAYATYATKDTKTLIAIFYVLLGFSIVVSLFGMVNTMVLAVFERTREIGMLRTLGLTRRQARRMIRHESVITALIGAALGLASGVLVAAAIVRAVPDLALSIPWTSLVAFTLVAVLAGVAAAVAPARRAARIDVLKALQYE
jgi:putative ABC transport system permease protein